MLQQRSVSSRCSSAHGCFLFRPTRNLGGALLKEEIAKEFVTPGCLSEPWQPPYTTATPEVTIRAIQPSDRFVVLASDGLWDLLSSQDVVDVIAEYETRKNTKTLPADFQGDVATYLISKALERVPLIVNNAPEDAQLEKISYIMRLPDTYKRSVYDDISVIVIFLNPSSLDATMATAMASSGTVHPTPVSAAPLTMGSNKFSKPPFPQSIERVDKFKTLFAQSASTRTAMATIGKSSVVDRYLQRCWPVSATWTTKNLSTTELFVNLGMMTPQLSSSSGSGSGSGTNSPLAASSE
jgi:hypothetical protein